MMLTLNEVARAGRCSASVQNGDSEQMNSDENVNVDENVNRDDTKGNASSSLTCRFVATWDGGEYVINFTAIGTMDMKRQLRSVCGMHMPSEVIALLTDGYVGVLSNMQYVCFFGYGAS